MRHHVIPFFHEDRFTVHTTIVDMIIGVVEQRRRTGHVYVQILYPARGKKDSTVTLLSASNRRDLGVSGSTANATLIKKSVRQPKKNVKLRRQVSGYTAPCTRGVRQDVLSGEDITALRRRNHNWKTQAKHRERVEEG
jgi:hypothetical protein